VWRDRAGLEARGAGRAARARARLSSLALAVGLAWALGAPGLALAAPSPSERALAESLFLDGQKLLKKGEVALACRKLEESYKLDPVGGTLLNLATCHEREGRVATAWAEFKSALELARQARRPDRMKLAQKEIERLEPLVPRLTITMAEEQRPKGLVVSVDGSELGAGSLGSALPLDPGPHRVAAVAPGFVRHEESVELTRGSSKTLALPPLSPIPVEKPSGPPPPPEGTWRWPAGLAALGLGVVGLGVGAGLGGAALDKGSAMRAGCTAGLCDAAGYAAWQDGRALATGANIAITAGFVVLGAGVVLVSIAPRDAAPWSRPRGAAKSPRREPRAVATLAPGLGGGTLELRW
jgi:Tfp pilus assembly protein PilF